MTTFYDKVLGINNDTKAKNLDGYYKMQDVNYKGDTSAPILNDKGLPIFSDNPVEDLTAIKLTREDIERSTVIVPDLSKIQAGDLLVKTEKDKTDIAIVVDSGYKSGETFNMANVLVLTVNNTDKRVALNTWGNTNTYSSFTDKPKDYIVRRLIKFTGDITKPNQFTREDKWDPIKNTSKILRTKLEVDSKNYDRWIPNTGELYNITAIKFEEEVGSSYVPLYDSDISVIIKAPTDVNYTTEGADNNTTAVGNNILINKGDGFEFYAKKIKEVTVANETITYKDYIKLATFKLNTNSTSANDRYTVEYDNIIFNQADGSTKEGFKLYYDGTNLVFKAGTNDFTSFGIRPISTNIRPGDDITLNFDLQYGNQLNSAKGSTNDFIAVYDKKMLWRANLYIDEGGADWNNIYPWNAPATSVDANAFGSFKSGEESIRLKKATSSTSKTYSDLFVEDNSNKIWYGENEWNRVYDGSIRLDLAKNEPEESTYLPNLVNGDGKQVVKISPFTYHPKVDGADTKDVKDVVSYSYGCNDNPFEFNDEMRQQQSFFSDYFNNQRIRFKKPISKWTSEIIDTLPLYRENVAEYILPDDRYPEDIISLDPYTGTNTTAINSSWDNYITPFNVLSITENSSNSVIENALTSYNITNSFPFLPGYALFYFKEHGNAEPPNWVNAVSAGADCLGFVSRSKSYTGNDYKWMDVSSQTIKVTSRHFIDVNYPTYDVSHDSVLITKKSDGVFNPNTDEWTFTSLDKIKPGDLMYYGNNEHIVMVLEVKQNNGAVSMSDIVFIESTWKKIEGKITWAKIYNLNTLESYKSEQWTVVRLKEK